MGGNNNKNGKKRPFGATIRTLNDISNGIGTWKSDADENNDPTKSDISVQHIPNIPNDKEASVILRRIHHEFKEIIERRKWNVRSITEMCCCGDGKDHMNTSQQHYRRRDRKSKIMPTNVLGYNLTASSYSKTHEIHLRLRHPHTHELLDYESIAGTMCHELAHCVRGPHDAQFYKTMNEIEEQHAVYLAKGVVLDKDGFPLGSIDAHVLGGGRSTAGASTSSKAAAAAESRRKKNTNGLSTQGYVLGGKKQSMPKNPREAARIAAERRLLDSQFCLPCDEVIEILGIDTSDEEIDGDDDDDVILLEAVSKRTHTSNRNGKNGAKEALDMKPKSLDYTTNTATTTSPNSSSDDSIIDLTEDSLEITSSSSLQNYLTTSASVKKKSCQSHPDCDKDQDWACPKCTLQNAAIVLVCNACHLERPTSKQQQQKLRGDEISFIKQNEVDQSLRTFGGFNIYGNKKNPSTMDHLT